MLSVALAAVAGVWIAAARSTDSDADDAADAAAAAGTAGTAGTAHGPRVPRTTHVRHRAGHGASALRPGSDPRVLPGNLLIADKANNRVVEVDRRGRMVWRFPRPGDLRRGETFRVPDDAFFSPDGRRVIATQEDDFTVSVIDVARHRIVYRYGKPGVPGAGPGRLFNPDDALLMPGGAILTADIKNCRLVVIHPPAHRVTRQLGRPGGCGHDPPRAFGSPNGAFPTRAGGMVVTEITGNWVDVMDHRGRVLHALHAPGFTYPSDTNEVSPGLYLSADYATPGAIETFDGSGRGRWRYAPGGRNALAKPSLALPLPNGDVLANDDANHRVIVVDPSTNKIVWQYGHTHRPGRRRGYLDVPDGVDLAPPYQLMRRFPRARAPHG
jgi:hypothetical protein